MAATVSRPSSGPTGDSRVDDVRALRFRVRDVALSGTYAAGGDTVTAASIGLKRILFATPQSPVAVGSTPATGNPVSTVIASDGKSVAFRLYEDNLTAAAGPLTEKNAEAYLTSQSYRVLFVGF